MSPETKKTHEATSEEGVLSVDGTPGVFIPARMLTALVTALRQVSGVSPVAFYNWGIECGREAVRALTEGTPTGAPEGLIRQAFERFQESGWGLLELREFRPKDGRVVAESPNPINVEWLAYTETKSPKTQDHFTRGYVTGVALEVTGIDVEGIEVSCRASGGETCVFRTQPVGPPEV